MSGKISHGSIYWLETFNSNSSSDAAIKYIELEALNEAREKNVVK